MRIALLLLVPVAVGGIVTLAHESWHLRGILNGARTQCYAVQTTEAVARSLGVAAVDARAVAVRVALDSSGLPRTSITPDSVARVAPTTSVPTPLTAWPSG
jgi:hypothetical protein